MNKTYVVQATSSTTGNKWDSHTFYAEDQASNRARAIAYAENARKQAAATAGQYLDQGLTFKVFEVTFMGVSNGAIRTEIA